MKLARIQKHWRGFVPAHYAHSSKLCAFYHCTAGRLEDGGRYCRTHRDQYDLEALRTPTKVLPFT